MNSAVYKTPFLAYWDIWKELSHRKFGFIHLLSP